jgi:hypothetical protein
MLFRGPGAKLMGVFLSKAWATTFHRHGIYAEHHCHRGSVQSSVIQSASAQSPAYLL